MPLKLSQQHERKRKHWRREKGKKKTNMNRALKVVMHTNYKFGLKGNPLLIQLYLMYQYTVIASLLLYCESQKGLVRVLWHISAYNSTAEMSEKIMKLVLYSCWLFEVQFYSYSCTYPAAVLSSDETSISVPFFPWKLHFLWIHIQDGVKKKSLFLTRIDSQTVQSFLLYYYGREAKKSIWTFDHLQWSSQFR